jgi:HD-like signal output (HDOD) protein
MQLLADDDVDVRSVTRYIKADAAFATKLLAIANSPLYGYANTIRTIEHAAIALGLDFVKSLAITVAMRSYLRTALKLTPLKRCWRHSLCCALVAEAIAIDADLGPDLAYTAGLLHDVGRLALLAAHPKEFSAMLSHAAHSNRTLTEHEKRVFGVDHCEAGLWVAAEWNLPRDLFPAIWGHHEEPAPGATLQKVVHDACEISNSLGYGVLQVSNASTITAPQSAESLDVPPKVWTEEFHEGIRNRITALE